MTTSEAADILGVTLNASGAERMQAYQAQRATLDQKLEGTTTAGMRQKYLDAIRILDEAYETLELNEDQATIPALKTRRTVSNVRADPNVTRREVTSMMTAPLPPPKEDKTKVIAVAVLAIVLAAGVGWYWGIYRPQKERAAGADASQPRLVRGFGGLVVVTEPPGARVALGGEALLLSPATFDRVVAGRYPLKIELEGYEPVEQNVEIKLNEFRQLDPIRLGRSQGSLRISTKPEGFEYSLTQVQGETTPRQGKTPVELRSLDLGEYRLVLRRPFFAKEEKTVWIARNQTTVVNRESPSGMVRLASEPSGATVRVDGVDAGQTPLLVREAQAGALRAELHLRGFLPATVSGEVRAGEELRLQATLLVDRSPASGQRWTNSLGVTFVPVAAAPFLLATVETRQQDFDLFVRETSHDAGNSLFMLKDGQWDNRSGHNWRNPGYNGNGSHPVVGVNWNDAQAFCRWLTEKERRAGLLKNNQRYRLPTDAEWSLGVGLGVETGTLPKDKDAKIKGIYSWGNTWPPPHGTGNLASSELQASPAASKVATLPDYTDGFERTAPVGSFKPNAIGLFDLEGNVTEWCEDFYDAQQQYRTLRGGAWNNSAASDLLAAARRFNAPDRRTDYYGFRLAIELEPASPPAAP